MQELQEYIVPSDASVKSDLSLKDFGAIWRRRKALVWKIVIGFLILGVIGAFFPIHRWYAESELVLIQRVPSAQINAQETYAAPLMEQVETPFDMIQTPQAYDLAIDWMKQWGVDHNFKIAWNQSTYSKHVSFNNIKGSNTIDVTSWAYDKKNAFLLADAAAQSFVAWKNQQAQTDVAVAIENYRRKVAEAKADLAIAQDRLERFQSRYQIANLDTEEKNDLDVMSAQQSDLLTAQQDAASENAKLAALKAQLTEQDKQIADATGVRDDTTTQAIQAKLIDAESRRSTMALHYTPLFPNKLGDVNQEIANEKRQLTQSIKGTLDAQMPSLQDQDTTLTAYRNQQVQAMFADAQLAAVRKSYANMYNLHDTFPARDLEYLRLSQDVQLKTQQYQALVAALSQAEVDKNTITGDVEMTGPTRNIEFNQLTYLLLFIVGTLFLGLFTAGCAVLLVEQGDTRLYAAEEVRRLLSGPVVGGLPELSRTERRALSSGITPNTLVDIFNVMRNNLQLVMRHYTQSELTDHQIVMFASAGADEGKSLMAGQLARSIAESGRSVLYVDANLRRDKERYSIAPREGSGLAQILSDGAEIDPLIVESQVPNLSILPSGEATGHTTDLISGAAMADAVRRLRTKAEVVVIDTPACTLSTDALYLAPYADCVLQVISLGAADETVLADTIAAVQAAAPKVVAYAINRTPRPKRRVSRLHYYSLELNGFTAKQANALSNGTATAMLTDDNAAPAAEEAPARTAASAGPVQKELE